MAFVQNASRLLFGAGAASIFGYTFADRTFAKCEEPAAAAPGAPDAPGASDAPGAPAGEVGGSIAEDLGLSSQDTQGEFAPKLRSTRRRNRVGRLPNPGRYEEIQKECKEVLHIDAFGGARFEINYMPVQTNSKQMGFCLNAEMDNSAPPGRNHPMMMQEGQDKMLEYGVTLANETQLFLARVYNDGRVMGRFHNSFSNKITTKCFFQSAQELSLMGEADFEGKDFFFHLKGMHTPDGPSLGTSYLQSITPSISLGAELMHSIDQGTHMSVSGRYAKSWEKNKRGDYLTGQLSTMGIIVGSYTHKISPHYLLSTEFMLKPNPWTGAVDPSCTIGALVKGQSFKFQASITNSLAMTASLENQVQPGLTVLLSGAVAHFKNTSKFGVGFRFG